MGRHELVERVCTHIVGAIGLELVFVADVLDLDPKLAGERAALGFVGCRLDALILEGNHEIAGGKLFGLGPKSVFAKHGKGRDGGYHDEDEQDRARRDGPAFAGAYLELSGKERIALVGVVLLVRSDALVARLVALARLLIVVRHGSPWSTF